MDEFRVAGPANLFIKPYDFVEYTPDFFMKFGSMVTKLSFFYVFQIHLFISILISSKQQYTI